MESKIPSLKKGQSETLPEENKSQTQAYEGSGLKIPSGIKKPSQIPQTLLRTAEHVHETPSEDTPAKTSTIPKQKSIPVSTPIEIQKHNESTKPAAKVQKTKANVQTAPEYTKVDTGTFEDPIAQANYSRVFFGGSFESVLKDTDARKAGVYLVKPLKMAALKGADQIELLPNVTFEKQQKQTLAKPIKKSIEEQDKSVAKTIAQATSSQIKDKKGTSDAIKDNQNSMQKEISNSDTLKKQEKHLNSNLNKQAKEVSQPDQTDPLEAGLNARKKYGSEAIPEAEVRKQNLIIPKSFKHKITGSDTSDLLSVQQKDEQKTDAKTNLKKDEVQKFGKQQVKQEQREQKQETIQKLKPKEEVKKISEDEVQKVEKSQVKQEQQDHKLEPNSKLKPKEDFKKVTDNAREEIKMKTKDALKESSIIDNTQQKKQDRLHKPQQQLKPKTDDLSNGQNQPDPTDIIEMSLFARKKNGGDALLEAEARKQKLTIPKPVKHKISGSETTDLIPAQVSDEQKLNTKTNKKDDVQKIEKSSTKLEQKPETIQKLKPKEESKKISDTQKEDVKPELKEPKSEAISKLKQKEDVKKIIETGKEEGKQKQDIKKVSNTIQTKQKPSLAKEQADTITESTPKKNVLEQKKFKDLKDKQSKDEPQKSEKKQLKVENSDEQKAKQDEKIIQKSTSLIKPPETTINQEQTPTEVEATQVPFGKIGNPIVDGEQLRLKQAKVEDDLLVKNYIPSDTQDMLDQALAQCDKDLLQEQNPQDQQLLNDMDDQDIVDNLMLTPSASQVEAELFRDISLQSSEKEQSPILNSQVSKMSCTKTAQVQVEAERQKIVEEIKEIAQVKIEIEIDVNLVKALWPYLRPQQIIPNDKILKHSNDLVKELRSELHQKIISNDERLEILLKDSPSCTSDNQGKFKLSDSAKNSLSILEDVPCDHSDWESSFDKSQWVARTLKLYLFCIKNFPVINKWARWPDIFHTPDSMFFLKASKAIEDDVEELGEVLPKKVQEMGIESMTGEQMARVECLLEHLGGMKMCDPLSPDYEKNVDSSVCQFIMFAMRDVLKYLGFDKEKQSIPSQEYKVCSYKKKIFAEFETGLGQAITE